MLKIILSFIFTYYSLIIISESDDQIKKVENLHYLMFPITDNNILQTIHK